MNNFVDLTPPVEPPLHRQVADRLRHEIRIGTWQRGDRLPSEQALAKWFGVARGTIRHALAALRAEGSINQRRGARATVLGTPRTQSFSSLLSFSAWARALGEQPGGRVVALARELADAGDAAHLAIAEGDPVFRLTRVRLLSGSPVMVERTTFVEPVGRFVAGLDLESDSIYDRLAVQGVEFWAAEHLIPAIGASAADAELLGVERHAPLLQQLRRSTAPDGTPLEWSDDRYRGDAVAFVVHNTRAATQNVGRMVASA